MTRYSMPLFPRSCRYQALALPAKACVKDGAPPSTFPWSERHLRCVWADSALRPSALTSMDGRTVSVVSPGRWNLEAGPDFLDAILKIGPDECTLRGDVELHIRPLDWRYHKHAADPRYKNVMAHITYFEGLLAPADMPASVLQIPLRAALQRLPSFSFDGLDLTAYPFAALARRPPCAEILTSWSPDQRGALLDGAGEERLRLKTERMTKHIGEKGKDQALYEELMGALGYKHNRLAFLTLARALPLERVRLEAASSPLHAYALFLGVGGLLPQQSNPLWDGETRAFIRALWDFWWKHQSEWHDQVMNREAWTLANLRPANHPLRRLMAAAYLFAGTPPDMDLFSEADVPAPCVRSWLSRLKAQGGTSYWAWRGSFATPRYPQPESLIGQGRAATILTNVMLPWWAATGALSLDSTLMDSLPQEDTNRFIKHTAHALFGHDHSPTLYNSGLRQQGLLQIFHDFCLSSKNGCAGCPLPIALAEE
ncbi:MAG: DUF2851 family protein [bacterium]